MPGDADVLDLEAGDIDEDGDVDLIALLRKGDELLWAHSSSPLTTGCRCGFAWTGGGLSEAAPAASGERLADAVLVDRDHDGDLDAFWCSTDGSAIDCRLATNDGKGNFDVKPGGAHGLVVEGEGGGEVGGAIGGPLQVGFSDFDNDRDIDLLLLASDGWHVFTNQRDDTFRGRRGRDRARLPPAARASRSPI